MKVLAEQLFNAALIAALPIPAMLLTVGLDWRVPMSSFLGVFLMKLVIARGLQEH